MRIDEILVKYFNIKSRNVAKQMIQNKMVSFAGKVIEKPSINLEEKDIVKIDIIDQLKFVSRAGYKLDAIINDKKINLKNLTVLDIGASTGGFCDCCLQNGANKVYAIDVGKDQLSEKLRNDSRVINLEGINIKNLSDSLINDEINFIVSDLSFISSKYMFEALEKIKISNHCELITLIKPQFELDQKIIKQQKYKITNPKYLEIAINRVKNYATSHGWKIKAIQTSPILGAKKENIEYLLWCEKDCC